MIKNGTRVVVEGKGTTVEGSWASGKHRRYILADGRTVLDLNHTHVEVITQPTTEDKPSRKPKRNNMPLYGEDHLD